MKREYQTPVMIMEEYVAEQYVAAGDCGISVGVPAHGHVNVKSGQIHCAFTSSNCGKSSDCYCEDDSCNKTIGKHNILTEGVDTTPEQPVSGHNCHILDTNDDAVAFAREYAAHDKSCANGVAALLNLGNGFNDVELIMS